MPDEFAEDHGVDDELISRPEVTAMLFTLLDIDANVERIVRLLENENDAEEGPEEDS